MWTLYNNPKRSHDLNMAAMLGLGSISLQTWKHNLIHSSWGEQTWQGFSVGLRLAWSPQKHIWTEQDCVQDQENPFVRVFTEQVTYLNPN